VQYLSRSLGRHRKVKATLEMQKECFTVKSTRRLTKGKRSIARFCDVEAFWTRRTYPATFWLLSLINDAKGQDASRRRQKHQVIAGLGLLLNSLSSRVPLLTPVPLLLNTHHHPGGPSTHQISPNSLISLLIPISRGRPTLSPRAPI